jgi:predicted RNA-binding protein with RPS1 domain
MSNTVRSTYIDNLCALLGINDISRVKIVGVRSGSSIIDVSIASVNDNMPNTTNTTTNVTTPEPTLAQVDALLSNAIQAQTLGASLEPGLSSGSVGTFLAATSVMYLLPTESANK